VSRDTDEYNYEKFTDKATGSHEKEEKYKTIVYPFDRFLITIKVTQANEFIAVTEVAIRQDFLSRRQRISPKGGHDVEEFYKE
jgi:hypothetical protein